MEYHSKIWWIPLIINFKSNLSNSILKFKNLQLTSLEMLPCVLQKSNKNKYGGNLTYLTYKKKTKGCWQAMVYTICGKFGTTYNIKSSNT
jgi:hypothetical protein